MRRQNLCDSSFESYNHSDSKNIEEKSWQPRGGTLERFGIFSTKMTKIAPQRRQMLEKHNIVKFSGSVNFKLQNKVLVDTRSTHLRTFQFFEFDFVGQFAWVDRFRALS